jgi:hypothetical protein
MFVLLLGYGPDFRQYHQRLELCPCQSASFGELHQSNVLWITTNYFQLREITVKLQYHVHLSSNMQYTGTIYIILDSYILLL